jgi:hypothetical protein
MQEIRMERGLVLSWRGLSELKVRARRLGWKKGTRELKLVMIYEFKVIILFQTLPAPPAVYCGALATPPISCC